MIEAFSTSWLTWLKISGRIENNDRYRASLYKFNCKNESINVIWPFSWNGFRLLHFSEDASSFPGFRFHPQSHSHRSGQSEYSLSSWISSNYLLLVVVDSCVRCSWSLKAETGILMTWFPWGFETTSWSFLCWTRQTGDLLRKTHDLRLM